MEEPFYQTTAFFTGNSQKNIFHLEEAVLSFLDDRLRPGQPSYYTYEQIIKILEIACRNPEELGYEVSH